MRTIFLAINMKLPDENQLMGLLKKRSPVPGTGSQYGAYRLEMLRAVSLLIKSYFHQHRDPLPKIFPDERCRFRFDWYEENRKRDPDNVTAGGRKIILDAMQAVGIFPTDGARAFVTDRVCMLDAFHYGHAFIGVQVFVQIFKPLEEIPPL